MTISNPLKKQSIAILGSTGSIGQNSVSIIRQFPEQFKIEALTANFNYLELFKQIQEFKPSLIAITDLKSADNLQQLLESYFTDNPDYQFKLFSGPDAVQLLLKEVKSKKIIHSISGAAGILPALEIINSGKILCLANKESLVTAGGLLLDALNNSGGKIIPIDSEHYSLSRCLMNVSSQENIQRVILTASGGPFHDYTQKQLEDITPTQALNHPNWQMGKRITIDSATMVNKCFEVIETYWLFNFPADKIDVIVHPQSIVHSLVEYRDRSFQAHFSAPDMKLPISAALFYPGDPPKAFIPVLDLAGLSLDFKSVNRTAFPILNQAYFCLKYPLSTLGAVFNAADETLVEAFLNNRIEFPSINKTIIEIMESHINDPEIFSLQASINQIIEADQWARLLTNSLIKNQPEPRGR